MRNYDRADHSALYVIQASWGLAPGETHLLCSGISTDAMIYSSLVGDLGPMISIYTPNTTYDGMATARATPAQLPRATPFAQP